MPTAAVIGSGPNGLVAAATLARAGWQVTVFEAAASAGGGTRSAELTEPGAVHDICSAAHPLGVASPALRTLPLEEHGLEWIQPPVPFAHALGAGEAVLAERSVERTADALGRDAGAYRSLMAPLVAQLPAVLDTVLARSARPAAASPVAVGRFGVLAARSAQSLAGQFCSDPARALVAGLAAHSVLPLHRRGTAGVALLLGALAHSVGWPVAAGGSQAIADALVALLRSHGGTVGLDHTVEDLAEVGDFDAVLADITPSALDRIAGGLLSARQRRPLLRFPHGPGVCKVDWLLDGPIPWSDQRLASVGTVHLGGTFEQIAFAEQQVASGVHPNWPYVLLAQQSLFDPSRVRAPQPDGRQVVWAYCHVPSGSDEDMSSRIAAVVEDSAPGFTSRIVASTVHTAVDMQRHNANYTGGDITGGVADLRGLLVRPYASAKPWRTPIPGVYLCSASTPPGAGVHGMCGLHAARTAMADLADPAR